MLYKNSGCITVHCILGMVISAGMKWSFSVDCLFSHHSCSSLHSIQCMTYSNASGTWLSW